MSTLFDAAGMADGAPHPLADRLRPQTLADVLGQERMLVVVTPARPQSPVEDLSYLAQDALDTTRAVGGTAFGDALAEAGFGETTRGAVALTDDSEEAGPGPAILSLELRTVAAD